MGGLGQLEGRRPDEMTRSFWLKLQGRFLPQGLCTHFSLCLEYSFLRYLCGSLLHNFSSLCMVPLFREAFLDQIIWSTHFSIPASFFFLKIFFFFWLKYSWYTILYVTSIQYSVLYLNFKNYTPFLVIIQDCLYSVYWTIYYPCSLLLHLSL